MFGAINQFYRFGEFTVDSDQKVLLQNGKPLPLPPTVFDTLLILVNKSGRIVEKDEPMLASIANNPQLIGKLGSEEIPYLALSPDENTFAFIRGKYVREAVLVEGLK